MHEVLSIEGILFYMLKFSKATIFLTNSLQQQKLTGLNKKNGFFVKSLKNTGFDRNDKAS